MLHSKFYVFLKTAEKLSFTKAAEVLFMTQPAVTKHIHKLEQELGVKLFKRTGHKIKLTTAGQILLKHAKKIEHNYNQLTFDLGQLADEVKGQIKIGASTTIAQYVLPGILSKFNQKYPELKITVLNGNSEQIEQLLLNETIDLGIIEGQTKRKGIQYQSFLNDDIVLVARPEVIAEKNITLDVLKTSPLIMRESGSGTRDVIAHYLNLKGYYFKDFNIVMEYGSTEGIKNYLLQSKALAFLSRHSIQTELDKGLLNIVKLQNFKIHRIFNFIYTDGQQNPLVDKFIRFSITSK
jgi:DNA-binding transcriptional LysR family regulator